MEKAHTDGIWGSSWVWTGCCSVSSQIATRHGNNATLRQSLIYPLPVDLTSVVIFLFPPVALLPCCPHPAALLIPQVKKLLSFLVASPNAIETNSAAPQKLSAEAAAKVMQEVCTPTS